MDNIIAGIKEEELQNLIIEIMNTADKINEVLNKYDDRFEELKDVYEGNPYDELDKYYNAYIRPKFLTIKNNIVSYADDLTALNRKMREGAASIAKLFNQFEDEVKDRYKAVTSEIK